MASNFPTIGNYRLLQELASGSFGRVYRAEHLYIPNRMVAVKILHTHLSSEKERNSFLREAKILAMLQHPYVLPLLDVGIHNGTPYMITELASQGSLRDRLTSLSPQIVPLIDTIRLLTQIAQALQVAHQQQIVHRDLKPDNVLFHSKGHILLADFGFSTVLSSMKSVNASNIAGTPLYMAPEQFKGNVSKESDQYALGCIAYELTTRRLPFNAPDFFSLAIMHMNDQPVPPKVLNRHLPDHISDAILKALAKDRQQRHVDVMAFIAALTPEVALPPSPSTSTSLKTATYPQPATAKNTPYPQLAPLKPTPYPHANNKATTYPQPSNNRGMTSPQHPLIQTPSSPQHAPSQTPSSPQNTSSIRRVPQQETIRYSSSPEFTPQGIDPLSASEHIERGIALHKLQRYEKALAAFEQAIRLNPQDIQAYYHKGLALYALQQYQKALTLYEQALQLNPRHAEIYYHKGLTHYMLKNFHDALAAFEQALHLKLQDVQVYFYKGLTLIQIQSHGEALLAFEQAILYNPQYAQAYYHKGQMLASLQRYAEALVAFEQTLRLDPQHVDAWYHQGLMFAHLKKYKQALAAYEQTITLDPQYADAYYHKGATLHALKRYREAQAANEQAHNLTSQLTNPAQNKTIANYTHQQRPQR